MNHTKQLINEWEYTLKQGICTKELQIVALTLFLENIGYTIRYSYDVKAPRTSTLRIVKLPEDDSTNPKFMSLETAIGLYNGKYFYRTNGTWFDVIGKDLIFSPKSKVMSNVDVRPLRKVYLQRDGKQPDGIKVQTNWVMFTKNEPVEESY